jgi:hypothetical protein
MTELNFCVTDVYSFLASKNSQDFIRMNFFADFLVPGHREWTQEGETKATLILRERKPNNPSSSTTQIHRLCVLQLMEVGAGWKCYCVFETVKKGQCWVHSFSFSLSLSSIRNMNTHKSSNFVTRFSETYFFSSNATPCIFQEVSKVGQCCTETNFPTLFCWVIIY